MIDFWKLATQRNEEREIQIEATEEIAIKGVKVGLYQIPAGLCYGVVFPWQWSL